MNNNSDMEINNKVIEKVEKIKYLGFIIDRGMNFKDHTNYIYKKLTFTNQVKTNMYLIPLKNFSLFALLLCHCSHLTDTTIIITITACSTQLFAILFTTFS